MSSARNTRNAHSPGWNTCSLWKCICDLPRWYLWPGDNTLSRFLDSISCCCCCYRKQNKQTQKKIWSFSQEAENTWHNWAVCWRATKFPSQLITRCCSTAVRHEKWTRSEGRNVQMLAYLFPENTAKPRLDHFNADQPLLCVSWGACSHLCSLRKCRMVPIWIRVYPRLCVVGPSAAAERWVLNSERLARSYDEWSVPEQ